MRSLNKIYFPNLNGLRFIAAFVVIIHHLEQLLFIYGLNNHWDSPVIKAIGGLGVELFFVLSGFLITFLLLAEENNTKTISIKDFYIRRILRIWPLYYLIIILAFFVLPQFDFFNLPKYNDQVNAKFSMSLILFVVFLPNLLLNGYGIVVPYASQSWSVGVEEQFYLIWPLIMKLFRNKLLALLSVIVFYLLIQYFAFRFIKHFFFGNTKMELFRVFWNSFHIQCMAIGGIFSYLLFKKHFIYKLLCNNYIFYFAIISLLLLIAYNIILPYFNRELYAIIFGIIILNLASAKSKGFFLENKIMNYLGKISYGLYMYHVIAIVICVKVFSYFNILHFHLTLLLSCLIITILFSSFSYKYIEKRFIILKTRYSKILSGDNVIKIP